MRSRTLRLPIPLVLLLLFALGAPAYPQAPAPLDRMTQLGRLWGTVRYLHPYLMDRDVDWDAALVAALPKVEAAKSREEYAAAVQGMLDALGDPMTRVLPPEPAAADKPAAKPADPQAPPLTKRLEDGTLVLDFAHAARAMGFRDLMRSINAAFQEINKEKAVIVDLRGGSSGVDPAAEMFAYSLDQVGGALISRPCRAPSQRYVLRSGYQTQEGSTSGSYYEGFVTPAALSFTPPSFAPTVEKRVVFLVGRGGSLPKLALALQAAGDARILAEGPIGEDSVVATQQVPIGEDLYVRLRVSELVPMPGWPGVHADLEVPPSDGKSDPAMTAAVAELKKDGWGKPAAATSASAALPEAVFRPDKTYPDMVAPDVGHRRLAVVRAWNVIHFFYPYLPLIGDWDAVLPEFLAKMEKADTGRAYAETVLEMLTHVPDGHTGAYGHPEMAKIQGEAGVPVAVRWIEGAAVVTVVGSEEIKAAGLAPGDAIVAVDGEPVAARFERLKRFMTASTEASLVNRLCASLLRGPEGPVTVTVQGLDGKTREAHLQRALKTRFTPPPQGDVVRILPGNLGYIDLTRLTIAEVEDAFERVKGTKAIIFDMRGYPQGTAWFVAPRINTHHAKIGAQFRRAQISAFSSEEGDAGFYFAQPLPELPPGAALYTGPTVMLIDDRAISQSEHSGLFYEAANGTKFIGTPTSGANGDVTTFTLPGGIHVSFTGHDVRHADGRQLQRVGLKPDIEVAPTRKGIRDGKDEVLERAVEVLTARPSPPPLSQLPPHPRRERGDKKKPPLSS